jgi:hypothetical protein
MLIERTCRNIEKSIAASLVSRIKSDFKLAIIELGARGVQPHPFVNGDVVGAVVMLKNTELEAVASVNVGGVVLATAITRRKYKVSYFDHGEVLRA